MTIAREDITGIVLAGGRGSRMGGVDKGLQNHKGVPLALHALLRLQPQVGESMVNANRNLAAYESFGVPVWPDAQTDYAGPLSGFLAGLEQCGTRWLATVPCDSPLFPTDLVQRLGEEGRLTAAGFIDRPAPWPPTRRAGAQFPADPRRATGAGRRGTRRSRRYRSAR